jgi:hypothetical protein
MNPCNPDPFTLQAKVAVRAFGDRSTHDLVAGNHGQGSRSGAAFNLVQLGVADTAGMNPDQYLRFLWPGRSDDIALQRGGGRFYRAQPVNAHGTHF